VVVSCKRAPEPEPPSYDPEVYGDLERLNPRGQVVVCWYHQTGVQEETLLRLVDRFNVENAWGVTVIGEYAGSSQAIYEKIVARSGSGVLPNIVTAEPYQTTDYTGQGVLVELGPYVESRNWGYTQAALRDFFRPVAGSQSETRYGWPLYAAMEVLYYNADWLAELGYTGPPKTWDEFAEMACAASDPEAGTYGYEFSVNTATFADMLANRGGQMLNADATAYVFGGAEGRQVLTFIQDLLNRGCATLEAGQFGDRADFAAGRVLFTIDSASALPDYRRAVTADAGFNWAIAPLPTTLETPVVYIHSPNFLLLETTPRQQLAAWLFLKWFTEPEQQAEWARALSHFPVRASAADFLQDYFAQNPQYQTAFGLLGYDVATEPAVAGYGVCRQAIYEMLAAAARGDDVEAQLALAVTGCNDSLHH